MVYSGQSIFHQFCQKIIFCSHFQQFIFRLLRRQTFIFDLEPLPPPRYLMIRPLIIVAHW